MKKNRGKRKKFIFVTGGVMSGVGKGTTCSAIAAILKSKRNAIKIWEIMKDFWNKSYSVLII